jgi:hypothetical protein
MDFLHLGALFLSFTIVADAGLMWTIIRSGHFSASWQMLRSAV